MPFVLPRAYEPSEKVVLVLAFGKLSILEACSVLQGSLERAESPCERVSVLHFRGSESSSLAKLAGIHKWGPMVSVVDEPRGVSPLVDAISSLVEKVRKLSVSGYDLDPDDYEAVVRSLLDSMKAAGHSKIRLLRPPGNELRAEDVRSRDALDVLAYPYHGSVGLGLTAWVPDSEVMRTRGTGKPRPRSEISMSPRLARLLVNLSGVRPGETLLDPFCGSGTILAEALLASANATGVDSSRARIEDAGRNLTWLTRGGRHRRYDLRLGDARNLGRILDRGRVEAVVTEPLLLPTLQARPLTRTAEAMMGEKEELYADALESAAGVISPGGRIVMVVPVVKTIEGEEVSIELDGRPLGLRHYQPGPVGFEYPVRLSFESTRWVRRAVYAFESPP